MVAACEEEVGGFRVLFIVGLGAGVVFVLKLKVVAKSGAAGDGNGLEGRGRGRLRPGSESLCGIVLLYYEKIISKPKHKQRKRRLT